MMNLKQLEVERQYRIQERLALSCGDKEPTKAELLDARQTVANEMKAIQDDLDRDEVVKDWVP
jgi:hypothetical protein